MIEEFRKVFEQRFQLAKEATASGEKVFGWLCTYVPVEILEAGGLYPMRIMGGAEDTTLADAHLYSNNCSFARNCLELALRKEYDFLEGVVAAFTCDAIRRLFDIWSLYLNTPFTHIIALPHKITENTTRYYKEELSLFKEALEKHLGKKITDDQLQKAIALHNETRSLLKELYELKKAPSVPISGSETMEVILAGMVLPKAKYNPMLKQLLRQLKSSAPRAGNGNVRILISGSYIDNPQYLRVIEELGADVVVDDLCNGSKYFWDMVDTKGNPMDAIAKRYLERIPCARVRPSTRRIDHLSQLVKDYHVEGVILEAIKFCDLYQEDQPLIKKRLKELDVPLLYLEREYLMSGVSQMRTRIQAFLENIKE